MRAFCSTSNTVVLRRISRDDPEHGLHDHGRQPERRLVQQQQPRLRHQAARDRDHLQLAARQRPAQRIGERAGCPGNRSNIASASRDSCDFAARRLDAPSMMFSLTVRPGKTRRPSGTCEMPMPHDRFRPEACDRLAVEQDFAGRRLREAGDRAQGGRLAGAVGAEQRHHLPFLDAERDAAQRFDLAVADHEIADFEQRHHSLPR